MKPAVVFLAGLFAAVSAVALVASECPVGCPMDVDQVCGSDGETYSNLCELGIAACQNPHLNITAEYEGECSDGPAPTPAATTLAPPTTMTPPPTTTEQCRLACTKEFVPVCGSNGKTYANYCGLLRDKCRHPYAKLPLVQHHAGVCKTKSKYQ